MSTTIDQNKAVIRRLLAAWNNRQPDAFDDIVAADVVRHCPATPATDVRNLSQLKEFFHQGTKIFPDSVQTIEHLVAEGSLVAAWTTYEGTQNGPMGSLPASGIRVKFNFGAVFRIHNEKIAEWWVTWDNLSILRTLGHMPDG